LVMRRPGQKRESSFVKCRGFFCCRQGIEIKNKAALLREAEIKGG